MMLDQDKVKWAIKSGLSAICANCELYWERQDLVPVARPFENFKPAEAGCGQEACGGPPVDLAFPQYRGPLRGKLASICFICGCQPDAAIEMRGRGYLGVCREHIDQFKRMLGKPGAPPPRVGERVVQLL